MADDRKAPSALPVILCKLCGENFHTGDCTSQRIGRHHYELGMSPLVVATLTPIELVDAVHSTVMRIDRELRAEIRTLGKGVVINIANCTEQTADLIGNIIRSFPPDTVVNLNLVTRPDEQPERLASSAGRADP